MREHGKNVARGVPESVKSRTRTRTGQERGKNVAIAWQERGHSVSRPWQAHGDSVARAWQQRGKRMTRE